MSALAFSHLTKSYGHGSQQQRVLQDASATVAEGECVTLLGPSGSGKSTLLHICGLIEPADHGALRLAGQDVQRLSSRERTQWRREQIGFIFQQFNLIPVMSVYDNVAYPLMLLNRSAQEVHQRVTDMLTQVGLASFAHSRPEQLSGGQRQRVAIARALVKAPTLLIADEPTASLDSDTAMTVVDLMKQLGHKHKTACLIATHDRRLVPFSDRVLQVEDGRVREQNDHQSNHGAVQEATS